MDFRSPRGGAIHSGGHKESPGPPLDISTAEPCGSTWRLNLETRRTEAENLIWKLVELRLWTKLSTPEVTPERPSARWRIAESENVCHSKYIRLKTYL